MTVYELLALLFSVIIWGDRVRNCRLGITAQLDSESALRIAVKLASPNPKANLVAAELALRTEQLGLDTILGQHWRNTINLEADALSRLAEGKTVPARLQPLPQDQLPHGHLFLLGNPLSDPWLTLASSACGLIRVLGCRLWLGSGCFHTHRYLM